MFKIPLRKFGYKYYEIEKLASNECSDIYSVQELKSGIFALKKNQIACPPETFITCPVIIFAFALAKNKIVSAISSG